ncbi:hypothetical protein KVT40_008792 [Elsinoe batatas]|uniref:Uncharacterized protein n=1 Tax=Elsinoe batatas TaxID=2601811 RepID=A0A8K0KTU2_9PEZI|nr:hypothetical protein KVT40_008792 [Elsinoe batatas]
MPTKPTATTWTLLFKSHTTTILLHVAKDHTFTHIKSELLSALKSRSTDGHFNGLPLPTSPDEISLAKSIDPQDLTQGWEGVEPSEEDEEMDRAIEQLDGAKGKGKGKAKGLGQDCPAGAGLRDGAVLAFKFAGEDGWVVSVPVFEDNELGGEEAEAG